MKKDQHHHRASLSNLLTKVTKNPYRKSNEVKFLETMANNEARKNNPTMPPEWLAPRKYRDDSANGLTKCIIDFIRFTGNQAERISNTGRMIDTRCTFADVTGKTRTIGQTKWIKSNGTNGTSDISATIAGKSVKIEVKINADRQSKAQKNYQQSVINAGGLYFIATSFQQFFDWYNAQFESDEN